jgi:hypothetical protein
MPPEAAAGYHGCRFVSATVYPRLSRIPVDARGSYIKEGEPDQTYPYLAFTLDDFDDVAADKLSLAAEGDEFAVIMHVRGRRGRCA